MFALVKTTVASAYAKCHCCEERLRKFEACLQLQEDEKPVRGTTYCLSCEDIARQNHADELAGIERSRSGIRIVIAANGQEHAKNEDGEWLY